MTDKENGISTLRAFCRFIDRNASEWSKFVILVTQQAEENIFFKMLPKDKVIYTKASANALILRAAGMAASGFVPWILGTVAEIAAEGYAAIREAVALQKLPVGLISVNGGFSSDHEGAASQLLEDLALMRTIPNINVLIPSDSQSTEELVNCIYKAKMPFYMRLNDLPVLNHSLALTGVSEPGGAKILKTGTGVTICACGMICNQAVIAAQRLEEQNISAEVIDCFSIKPFPERVFLSSIRKTGCCVVAEEHSVIGGLFGAAAESSVHTCPVPMRSVSVENGFVDSGAYDELCEYYGLTWREIVDAASQVAALKADRADR